MKLKSLVVVLLAVIAALIVNTFRLSTTDSTGELATKGVANPEVNSAQTTSLAPSSVVTTSLVSAPRVPAVDLETVRYLLEVVSLGRSVAQGLLTYENLLVDFGINTKMLDEMSGSLQTTMMPQDIRRLSAPQCLDSFHTELSELMLKIEEEAAAYSVIKNEGAAIRGSLAGKLSGYYEQLWELLNQATTFVEPSCLIGAVE